MRRRAREVASGGTSLAANVWYHLAGTYDDGVAGLYVNGTEVDSKSVGSIVFTDASGGPVPKTIYVGVSHNAHSSGSTYENHLHYPLSQGTLVDRIRVHDHVLSGSELEYFFGTSTQSLQVTSVSDLPFRIKPLEDVVPPIQLDLLPESDSGLFDDDNLTNIRTATIEITTAEAGEAIRVYRDVELVGEAAHHDGLLYRYTFAVGELVEGPNRITARSFDGLAESADSPPLVITLDTLGPRILAATPSAPFDLRAEALDSIAVTFSEPIHAGSFTVDDVLIQGPAGAIAATDITAVSEDQFQIHFAPQTLRGTYRVTVGPAIADLAGNLMDQNNDGVPGEPADAYQYAFAAYDADIVFSTATTIAEGNTTYEGQHLLINGTTVTIKGPQNFGSVHLINGAVLTHSPNTTTQTHRLELTVTEQVVVNATSRIDVSGRGYLAGYTTGNTTVGGATSRSGGSYGGLGGRGHNPTGSPNTVYGDYAGSGPRMNIEPLSTWMHPPKVPPVFCGAVRGTSSRASCVPLTATTINPGTVTTTWVFAWPRLTEVFGITGAKPAVYGRLDRRRGRLPPLPPAFVEPRPDQSVPGQRASGSAGPLHQGMLTHPRLLAVRRRLRRMQRDYQDRRIKATQIRQRLVSWFGHARHANTDRLIRRLLRHHPFLRHAVQRADRAERTR